VRRLWIWILNLFRHRPEINFEEERIADTRGLYEIRRSIPRVIGPFKIRIGFGSRAEPAFIERWTKRGGHFRTLSGIALYRKRKDIIKKL
jgi:hypothetical protein